MITDEQIMKACDAYDEYNVDHNNTLLRGACSGHAMRKALEAYEQSKWVKFDINDKNTFPPRNTNVLVRYKTGDFGVDVFLASSGVWENTCCETNECITHWQPLPTFNP